MIINDSRSIALKFNEFFGSMAKEIDKKIPKSKRTYTDDLKNINLNSLLLINMNNQHVQQGKSCRS